VQGEERDVTLISLGVAPDAPKKKGGSKDTLESHPAEGVSRLRGAARSKNASKVSAGSAFFAEAVGNSISKRPPSSFFRIIQATGVMGRPDGLALVNVMLSRARLRTAVNCSIAPWEINLQKMTRGMFLIASILAVGQVVAVVDKSETDIHPNLLAPTGQCMDCLSVACRSMALSIRKSPTATPPLLSKRPFPIISRFVAFCTRWDGSRTLFQNNFQKTRRVIHFGALRS